MDERDAIGQSLEEEQLILQVRSGNEFVLKRIYRDNFPVIQRFILNNSGDEDDAKDLFQEAFMVFYQKITGEDFKLNCSVKTFLFAVSRNLWLKRLRLLSNRQVTSITDDFDLPAVEDEVQDFEERSEEIRTLKQAMEQLGEPCKTILEDFFYHKLSMEEIARKMGYTNAANAKNQKYKCFNRLKKYFLVVSRNNRNEF